MSSSAANINAYLALNNHRGETMDTAVAEPLTETKWNRPTKPDTCYNCGSTGACKKWRGIGGCVQHPRPLTLEIHKTNERYTAINAMTSAQRTDVLQLLAWLVPEKFDVAVAHKAQWGES